MKPALLIIDVQTGLCTGAEAAFDIDRVVGNINAVSARARAAGMPVVVVQHEEDGGMLRHGSAAWQVYEKVDVQPGDLHVRKTAPDSFQQTDLQAQLAAQGVDELIVCGLQSDCCVNATARGGISRGYPVTLLADAHSTVDSGGRSAAEITAEITAKLAAIAGEGPRVKTVLASDLRIGT